MVSIPDWGRVRGGGGLGSGAGPEMTLQPPHEGQYDSYRTQDVVKLAEDTGYLTTASARHLQEDLGLGDLSKVTALRLDHARLGALADIPVCTNLSVLVLGGNYISRIDGLVSCVHLIRLDLRSNQIDQLPGRAFWGALAKLSVLLLHDNPLGQIDHLYSLAACSSLVGLTLFDTPLSLKRNYRHHVVNCIWSLRALDHHVVSDEEIIEEAHFGGRFAALNPAFSINLCQQQTNKDVSPTGDLLETRRLVTKINHIMAHNSPVLIIQRHVRGHQVRRHFKSFMDMRIWAAVTIQRQYRIWRTGSQTSRERPPLSRSPIRGRPTKVTPTAVKSHVVQVPTQSKLDYDTYLRNRRPGSVALSDRTMSTTAMMYKENGLLPDDSTTSGRPLPPVPSPEPPSIQPHKPKPIYINLSKLHASLQVDAKMAGPWSSSSESSNKHTGPRSTKKGHDRALTSEQESPKRPAPSVQQMLGPVVPSQPADCSTSQPSPEKPSDDEGGLPIVAFRLQGRRQTPTTYDPTTELILARQLVCREIRAAENDFHRQQTALAASVPSRVHPTLSPTNEFSLPAVMGLTCLSAIQQAYQDRDRAKRQQARVESVDLLRQRQDTGRERIRRFHEERRQRALQARGRDHKQIQEHLDHKALERQDTMDRHADARQQSSLRVKQRRAEHSFVTDFTIQNTSVSKALQRHDRQARADDLMADAGDRLAALRTTERDQHNSVSRYLEHRQLLRQTESAMARAAVDTKMLQDASDRLLSAKNRVALQKSQNAQVQAYYPLPALDQSSIPRPCIERSGSVSMKHFNKWNMNKLNKQHTMTYM